MRKAQLIPILIFAFFFSGCSASVDLQMDEDYSYLTISMTEEQATEAIEYILSSSKDTQIIDPQADLREGEIYIVGQIREKKTGELYSGSLTLYLWAEDGELRAKVIQLDFKDWKASATRLDNFNRLLSDGLARKVRQKNNKSELTEVVILDSELAFTWKTPRQK